MASEPKRRYELKRKIGAGDFATVFEAQDTKLGRDVAIKQLHKQYLGDSDKLARYWHEAQLLVSLEHPNIMTIYDVVKTRGSLVLELMQGSLKQIYGAQPMPVEDVRQTISQAAAGLNCLHENGIIHGDIKPANLLLSRQSVVKLGDFGLARRASDAEGSMLKGATKYMAPELVSDQFGDVGPASDLYSLGFSALELLVGPEFDTLFPDLIAFGRDQQMAWMMWHCSADRKLPRVQSMLDGVPNDVAKVIEKLTAKDQTQRYKTAKEVLADLSGSSTVVGQSLKDAAAAEAEAAAKKKKKRRILAAVACAFSLIACGIILWLSQPKPPPVVREDPPPVVGVVQNLLARENQLVIDVNGDFKEFKLRSSGRDKIILNRQERPLRDLLKDDRILVRSKYTKENKLLREFVAFRPETQVGTISSIDLEDGSIVFNVGEGAETGEDFKLKVLPDALITLNQKDHFEENSKKIPLTLAKLQAGDRVTVSRSDDESGMLALGIDASRMMTLKDGVVRKLNLRTGEIFVAYMDPTARNAEGELAPKEKTVAFRLDTKCVYTLNGLKSIDEKLVKSTDIQEGDEVSFDYELKIVRLDAHRVFRALGSLEEIRMNDGVIRLQTEADKNTFTVSEKTKLTLGGIEVSFSELRVRDEVEVVHESPDDAAPELTRLTATRPTDGAKWAFIIANRTFADKSLPVLERPLADARALRNSLVERYAVPDKHVMMFEDAGRVRWEQDIPQMLSRVPDDAEVYVYVSTHAFGVKSGDVYLANSESNLERIDETGIQLTWLIDQIENCDARRKLLLLDCSHPEGKDPRQKSTTELIEMVKAKHRGGYPRKTYVLASCLEGQSGVSAPDDATRGLFAFALTEGFAGAADLAGDNRLEFTELVDYVETRMSELGREHGLAQMPKFFTPDDRPPRISGSAKQAIVDLMSRMGQKKLDVEVIQSEAARVERMAANQPEAMLVCGILMIKASEMTEALEVLEKVRQAHPNCLLAHESVIWLHFYKKDYARGTAKLSAWIKQIPKPKRAGDSYTAAQLRKFEWAGRLRELAVSAMKMVREDSFTDWTQRVPSESAIKALDDEVAQHGAAAKDQFTEGRKTTYIKVKTLREKFKTEPSAKRDLQRLKTYVDPIAGERALEEIRQGLDR